jgi:hypothetical protein
MADPIYPRAAELYAIADALSVVSTKTVHRSESGLITTVEDRKVDPSNLIAKGQRLIAEMRDRGERLPWGLPAAQFYDAGAKFLRGVALHDPIEHDELIAGAAILDQVVVLIVEGGMPTDQTAWSWLH